MSADKSQHVTPIYEQFLKGQFGGWGIILAGHPLDTIKVRLQTSTQFTGLVDCFKQTVRKEGPLGLYKGALPPMVGIGFLYSIVFAGYGLGVKMVRHEGQSERDLSLTQVGAAAMVSGACTTVAMVPMEQIKIRMQIDGQGGAQKKYNGTMDCAKHLYRDGGVRSLYRGSMLTLGRDCPGSAAWFAAYEYVRRSSIPEGGTYEDVSPLKVLFAGGMAGIANWMVALPFDTLKSRVQANPGKYTGGMDCFRQLMQTEGPAALYKGLAPVLLRAFPANAACFFCADMAARGIAKIRQTFS